MKTTKRVIAVVLAILMVASVIAVLAACGNTASVNWDNYVLSAEDYADLYNGKLPSAVSKVSTSNIPSDATVNAAYADEGLVMVGSLNSSYVYGYLVAADKTFGKYDYLRWIEPDKTGFAFIATTSNDEKLLYDQSGEKMSLNKTAERINTRLVKVFVDGKIAKYLEINSFSGGSSYADTTYCQIKEDGTLGGTVSELPTSNSVKVGDSITKATQTLGEWLARSKYVADSELEDVFLSEVTVLQTGRAIAFYKGNKKLSTFTVPMYLDAVTYVGGKLIYTTKTPVDEMRTSGFNFVEDGEKFDVSTYSFNLKTGATKELHVDYVLKTDETFAVFNRKKETYDLVMVDAYREVDGVARNDDESGDVLVINNKGAIADSSIDDPLGMPLFKIGDNYIATHLTFRFGFSVNIVNKRGALVAALGNTAIRQVLSNELVVTQNGKVGKIDFNGVVTMKFENTLKGDVYGDYACVTNKDGTDLILNVATGKTKDPSDITSLFGSYSLSVQSYFIKAERSDGTVSWYLLDGTKVAENTLNNYLHPSISTINGKSYGLLVVQTENIAQQCIRYVF